MNRSCSVLALTACGALFSSRSAHAADFYGPDFVEGAAITVDVVSAHLDLLRKQHRYDASVVVASATTRGTPGEFHLWDGSTLKGGLAGAQLSVAGGGGDPSKWSLYGGATVQYFFTVVPDQALQAGAYQRLGYLGVAARGLQFSLGKRFSAGTAFGGINSEGDFVRDDFAYSPESDPLSIPNPEAYSGQGQTEGYFLALSHKHAQVAATVGVTQVYDASTESLQPRSGLVDVRIHVQPAREVVERYLTEKVGSPFLAVTKLDPYQALWRELGAEQASEELKDASKDPYEVDLGSDDLLSAGIRAAVVTRLDPQPRLSEAELGWVWTGNEHVVTGVRAMIRTIDDAYAPAADGFVMVTARPGGMSLSASYSYNSPDGTNFIPLPDAHVFGLQLLFGQRDAAPSLIPWMDEQHAQSASPDGAGEEDDAF